MGDLADSIEEHTKANWYSVFDFIRHGVGLNVLESLMLYLSKLDKDMLLVPGMVLSIELAIAQGNNDCYLDDNGWTYSTCGGKLAARRTYTT